MGGVSGVHMPRGEDYASIPSYGAFDPDDESDEDEYAPFDRRDSAGEDERRGSIVDHEARRVSVGVEDTGERDAARRASEPGGVLARSGTVASRVSYRVGDEAGMTATTVSEVEERRGEVVEVKEDAPKQKKTLGMCVD